ncbi:MAG: DUF6768 family protein [Thermoanaerobaculia bacterium]|nr:DUF6768 family protein [Thermoanaerobaculia bacterium]
MSELDDKIRQALDETGVDLGGFGPEDDSFRALIADAYRGKLRWVSIAMTFWQLVFFVVFVWAGVRFFSAATAADPLFWATIFLMTGVGVSMMKILHWMTINRNRLLREIKRLELEVARMRKVVGE